MKILVIGLGYIGISTALYFTKAGVKVHGMDLDLEKLALIRKGEMPQKDLESWLDFKPKKYLKKLTVSHLPSILKDKYDAIFIAIPTEKDGEPWFEPLENVIELINESKNKDTLTIIESTLTPGIADKYIEPYLKNFAIAPRRDWFTDKDKTLETLPRIIGGNTSGNTLIAKHIISKVCNEIHTCTYKEAQLVKACENTLRHIGAVFAQQLAWAYPNIDTRKVLKLASSKWNIPEYFANILGTSGYAVDEKTEILTNQGWKKYNELDKNLKALTLNEKERYLEYKNIKKIFIENYMGKMIHIKSSTSDMLLHPNHRVLLYKNDKSSYYYKSANKLPKILRIPASGYIKNESKFDPFYMILGWIYADGSLWHPKSRMSAKFEIGQSKLNIVLENDLIEANIKYRKDLAFKAGSQSKSGYKCTKDFYKYHLTVEDTKRFLKYLNTDGSFKRNVFNLSPENQKAILAGVLKGDGNFSTTNNRIWQKNCDQLQELAILSGYRANIVQDKPNLQSMILFYTRPDLYLEYKKNVEEVYYNGYIWCVQVEDNSNFIARRNGKVFITGNCIPVSSKYVQYGATQKYELDILDSTLKTDQLSVIRIIDSIIKYDKPKNIGILGMSYLGDIKVHVLSGCLRFIENWEFLKKNKTIIKVHDPLYTEKEIKKISGKQTFDLKDLNIFDAIIVASDHKQYKNINKKALVRLTKDCKFILDNCAIWEDVKFKCPYIVPGRKDWLNKLKGEIK